VARHDLALENIDQRFQKAYHSANCDVEIAEFVHWATDCYMDLMNRDPATKTEFADWGLKMMRLEKTACKRTRLTSAKSSSTWEGSWKRTLTLT
jgi:hypothetical protein